MCLYLTQSVQLYPSMTTRQFKKKKEHKNWRTRQQLPNHLLISELTWNSSHAPHDLPSNCS
jgi:hypothetical protein